MYVRTIPIVQDDWTLIAKHSYSGASVVPLELHVGHIPCCSARSFLVGWHTRKGDIGFFPFQADRRVLEQSPGVEVVNPDVRAQDGEQFILA